MKKLFIFSVITCLSIISCKKENKIDEKISAEFSIENLEKTNEAGKVVFSKEGQPILIFDNLENAGKIKIDGKEIPLTQISFEENIYTIEGENISILAENGDFQDITTDCIEGNFPKIKITYNGKTTEIENIQTKECPENQQIID